MQTVTMPPISQNISGGNSKFLITIIYNNGTQHQFYLNAKKLLSAEWIVMNKMKHLLVDSYSMSTETI